jgi:signal transduction histidine kinase
MLALGTIVFCLVTAGLLLSIFLVVPLFQLITRIRSIEAKTPRTQPSRRCRKARIGNFLFHEVFSTVDSLEKRLESAEKERLASEAAKQAWLEGVSHDLKTPLSYITGYSSLMLTPGHNFDEGELRQYHAAIYDKGQEISELIDAMNLSFMLDSGTHAPLNRNCTDPSQLLSNIVEKFSADKRWEQYRLIFIPPDRPLSLWLDAKLITRVLSNLVLNGFEHNPVGTTVSLACFEEPDGSFIMAVEDDGSGMDPETLRYCLKKHYSGGVHAKPGKGMGLAIVKSILDAHGAGLTIESREGHGTRMRVVFPKENLIDE